MLASPLFNLTLVQLLTALVSLVPLLGLLHGDGHEEPYRIMIYKTTGPRKGNTPHTMPHPFEAYIPLNMIPKQKIILDQGAQYIQPRCPHLGVVTAPAAAAAAGAVGKHPAEEAAGAGKEPTSAAAVAEGQHPVGGQLEGETQGKGRIVCFRLPWVRQQWTPSKCTSMARGKFLLIITPQLTMKGPLIAHQHPGLGRVPASGSIGGHATSSKELASTNELAL